MKHDMNAVLDLWASELPSGVISSRLGISEEYIRVMVQRARRDGDPRAKTRPRGGLRQLPLTIDARKSLAREARRRGVDESELSLRIVEAVAVNDLFCAVLDE